jgi:hypothetical protein
MSQRRSAPQNEWLFTTQRLTWPEGYRQDGFYGREYSELAWHDRQRAEREASFRGWQIFWSRWTAFAATATALVAAIGWIVTIWRK